MRLHSLLRLQLSAQHTRELSTLDRALAYISRKSVEYGNIRTLVPFEIDVFRAKAARDADGTAYEALTGLLRRCQERARESKETERDVWVKRAGRVGAVLIGALLDHKVRVLRCPQIDTDDQSAAIHNRPRPSRRLVSLAGTSRTTNARSITRADRPVPHSSMPRIDTPRRGPFPAPSGICSIARSERCLARLVVDLSGSHGGCGRAELGCETGFGNGGSCCCK